MADGLMPAEVHPLSDLMQSEPALEPSDPAPAEPKPVAEEPVEEASGEAEAEAPALAEEKAVEEPQEAEPEGPLPLMLFYDFDCTISQFHVFSHSQGKPLPIFVNEFNEQHVIGWFGGQERVERLRHHFETLANLDVKITIISFGWTGVIQKCLEWLDLKQYFRNVYGRDAPELQTVWCKKALLIGELMRAEGAVPQNCIFLDDDQANVEMVQKTKKCYAVEVNKQTGIDDNIMESIVRFMVCRRSGEDWTPSENEVIWTF